MNRKILLAAAAVAALASACKDSPKGAPTPDTGQASGADAGTKPVTTGVVVRGLELKATGSPGTPTGRDCDFSKEEVGPTGHMTGASVQCLAGGKLPEVLASLPSRFDAYCSVEASRLKGRLIPAPIPGNDEHCDLSAITPKDAQAAFGGARWR